jgi:uncharacterized membrane protein YqjE
MSESTGFQRVTRDILDLCELQMQLISVDSQAAKRKLVTALICGIAAVTIAGSALTAGLVAAGIFLAELTALSQGGAMVVVTGLAFAIVIALLTAALSATKAAVSAMAETRSEFAENLRWLKATLIKPETSPRNQIRRDTFPESHCAADGSPFRSKHRFNTDF